MKVRSLYREEVDCGPNTAASNAKAQKGEVPALPRGKCLERGRIVPADPQIVDRLRTEIEPSIALHPNEMVRVAVYSDHPIMANGLGSLIAADPALEWNACCSNIAALKEHLASGTSDLAVLDLTPEITVAMLNELRNIAPKCKLILWTNSIASDFTVQAIASGIRGVLRKSLSLEAHRQCLHRVYSGELWVEKSLTDSFRVCHRVSLTPRESQLVTLLSRGLKNKAIAGELGITEGTVKVYLSHLFRKSGVNDRFDMALQGLKNLNMPGVSTKDQDRLRSLVIDPCAVDTIGAALHL